jgi:uncharacterized FlaG/YvyC family protein
MDIQAPKPVSSVSASPAATGKSPVVAIVTSATVTEAVQAVEPTAVERPPPAQNLLLTQQAIAEQVSRYLQSTTRNLEFQVDSESGTAIIVVRDASGSVIRRIPGEEAMQLMRRLNADSGTLLDSTA